MIKGKSFTRSSMSVKKCTLSWKADTMSVMKLTKYYDYGGSLDHQQSLEGYRCANKSDSFLRFKLTLI